MVERGSVADAQNRHGMMNRVFHIALTAVGDVKNHFGMCWKEEGNETKREKTLKDVGEFFLAKYDESRV